MFDDAAPFEQSGLFGVAHKEGGVYPAGQYPGQVGFEFPQLPRAVEDIGPSVVVEEERGVVKMGQSGYERPLAGGIVGGVEVAFERGIVGREIGVVATVAVTQRGGPLSASVDGALHQIILRFFVDTVVEVAHDVPVDQVFGVHDGGARHEVHRGTYQVEVVAHAYHVGVGNIGPHDGVGKRSVVVVARLSGCHTASYQAD